MRAIRITAPGEVEITEIEKPVPGPGEALLRLLYGGICGSDLSAYRGSFAYFSYPRVPGHEFSAEITEIGENDRGLKAGMTVTCNPYFNCGACYSCRRGMVNCCEGNQTMGVQREGAFAEYITMPVSRIYDGKGLPAKTLAVIEPFCVSHHGIDAASVKPGERALVVGAGTIGVLAGMSAKARGARVVIADVSPEKLRLASGLGFGSTTPGGAPGAIREAVRRFTDGEGFDVTVEAVGQPSTFQDCIDAAAFGGRVIVIGVSKQNLDFNFTVIQRKELRVIGSRNALPGDFAELIDLTAEGAFTPERAVTHTLRWTDAAEAFRAFDRSGGDMLKVMLDFT